MRFPYIVGIAPNPQPSLGGSIHRARPLLAVRMVGPTGALLRDGLLDTGSDDTVFDEALARSVGLDLTGAPQYRVNLAGRGVVTCRYADVVLRISDGVEEFEWRAAVGFVLVPLRNPLLGYAGFLQFFDALFQGADQQVMVTPNRSFAGKHIP